MPVSPDSTSSSGLVHAFVLDGQGGARPVAREAIDTLQLGEQESLWTHWDRGYADAQAWLRERSGLSPFACDLLLEENTRPRLLAQPGQSLLLFMRGINLNPGAEPEDMVSLRVQVDARRLISLRLRPLRSINEVIALFEQGRGPRTSSELLLELAQSMTDRLDDVVVDLAEQVDREEELAEQETPGEPDHGMLLGLRQRSAALRRFLLPQRDLFAQLARQGMPWFVADDVDYWNELNNRLIRYLEDLELVRERVVMLLDAEQQRLAERTNRTIYLLTLITAFFLPLSFVTGLLGINVGGIPGAEYGGGFAVVCFSMLAIALVQLVLFRRLRWL